MELEVDWWSTREMDSEFYHVTKKIVLTSTVSFASRVEVKNTT